MRVIADLHVHSRYSRACSQLLTLENNALWCAKKGVNVLGTGDFTHPKWFSDIEEQLEEAEPGLYKLKSGAHASMRFLMTSEVSQIYKRGGKTRRVHNLLFAPNIAAVRKINAWLDEKKFNRKADGRPILGLDSEVLYRELKNIDPRIVLTPAHAWTPWFALFGSKSGFDTLEDCFGEMSKEVFAIETGLSSDPLMNRTWSALDKIALISNSDAHSPQNFGREANVFDIAESEFSFDGIMSTIKSNDPSRFLFTIEFYPEEGKYHVDGHGPCKFTCSSAETKRLGGMCPKCGGRITVGVLSQVHALAKQEVRTEMPVGTVPFKSIVPLPQVIADSLCVSSPVSKKVVAIYEKMIAEIGNEFFILLEAEISSIENIAGARIAEAIRRVRKGELHIVPGYDGIYGVVEIFSAQEKKIKAQQTLL